MVFVSTIKNQNALIHNNIANCIIAVLNEIISKDFDPHIPTQIFELYPIPIISLDAGHGLYRQFKFKTRGTVKAHK